MQWGCAMNGKKLPFYGSNEKYRCFEMQIARSSKIPSWKSLVFEQKTEIYSGNMSKETPTCSWLNDWQLLISQLHAAVFLLQQESQRLKMHRTNNIGRSVLTSVASGSSLLLESSWIITQQPLRFCQENQSNVSSTNCQWKLSQETGLK